MLLFATLLLGLSLPGAFSYLNITEFEGKSLRFNDYSSWMNDLPSTLYLSEISMPGTHDTMARHGGPVAECQDLDLTSQLNYGIRFLDIRCRHIEDVCAIHHGVVFQEAYLGDVLDDVISFLQSHPSEVVIMRLKEEYEPENNSRSLEDTIEWYISMYGQHIWNGGNVIPRLGDVRGKIVIYDQIAGGRFGIDWNRCSTCIQDEYQVNSVLPVDIDKKWNYINNHLSRTNSDTNVNNFYINFLSGASIGAYPDAVSDRINPRFTEKLRLDSEYFRNIGAIMMDYPLSEQIMLIIELNFLSISAHIWLYEHSNYSGESKMFSVRPGYCMNLEHWDDFSSSLTSGDKCLRIFDQVNCDGCFHDIIGDWDVLGAWNDRITSIANC